MKNIIQRMLRQLNINNKNIESQSNFKNEEEYLMYLATSPMVGLHTKNVAIKRLHSEYPNGLFSLCKSQNKKIYKIKYRYKDMDKILPAKGEYDSYLQQFKAIVSYEVYDVKNNKILCDRKCRVLCGFNNCSLKKDEINLFIGLTYDDLSQEVREQILLDKLKEIIQIRLKLSGQKWSDFHEAVIEIEED